jgi:hypothetical protein
LRIADSALLQEVFEKYFDLPIDTQSLLRYNINCEYIAMGFSL